MSNENEEVEELRDYDQSVADGEKVYLAEKDCDGEWDADEVTTLSVMLKRLYEQPWNIVVNELGEIAVACRPCTKALVYSAPDTPETVDSMVLMRPVDIGFETAARCEECGALGPMVSLWGDDNTFGSATIIFGQEPTRAPETWEQGSVTGTP